MGRGHFWGTLTFYLEPRNNCLTYNKRRVSSDTKNDRLERAKKKNLPVALGVLKQKMKKHKSQIQNITKKERGNEKKKVFNRYT